MSEFQASLLLIGALVVIGVFGYNKWQEYRAGRMADDSFKSRHPDVLIGEDAGVGPRPGTREESRIEPGLFSRPAVAMVGASVDNKAQVPPDARIDYAIELAADEAVSAVALSDLWSAVEHRFARRASLAGWIDGQWSPLLPGGSSSKLRAALQLVSRKGVVGESELLEFRSAVETLAAKLQLSADAPEMRDALESARALDGICAEADIQIAFHVIAAAGATFAGTKVRAAAEASGLVLDTQGRFTLLDEGGRELYELGDRSGTKFSPVTMKDAAPQALTLSMDVPRAPDTQRTFEAMLRFGKQLANLLGGGLVDDNNQPLDERAVSAINAQLTVVRRNLEAQGIAPGSALALRLFS